MQSRILPVAVIVTAVTASLLVASTPASAAPTLPSGFVLTDLPTGQAAYNLTDFAYLPDGSMLTTGKQGTVAWVSSTGAATTLATLPVVTTQDMGLVSIALDKDFATDRFIYLTSNRSANGQTFNRLTRWTVSGSDHPTGITDERTILEYPAVANIHALWGLLVAPDGTLWVSAGDSSDLGQQQALTALDLDQPYGKVMHINADGTGVKDNPYYDGANPSSWRSRIYASGFRSPFRFSFDPASGTPILGDVGWNTLEEIDLIQPGGFYGWPCWEADLATSYMSSPGCAGRTTYTKPIFSYPRSFGGSAVTGGVVYQGESYPAEYHGAYFFGDYAGKRLWTMKIGSDGTLVRAPEATGFATDIGGPVKFGTAANGDIVFADIIAGTLHRLSYAPGNHQPVAKVSTTNDPNTLAVTFDATESYDPDGDLLTYSWDFGDGVTANATGNVVTHTYPAPGNGALTATLTVTDPLGASTTDQITVVPANHAPTLNTQFPPAGTTYKIGDQVTVSASATDVEDGALQVQWTSELLHCRPTGCHSHPGESGTGPTFQQTFTDHGEDTRLHITAHATDSRGSVTERTFVAEPRQHTLKLTSNWPAAMQVQDMATNETQVTAGATVMITAAATTTDGVSTFDSWTDAAGVGPQRQFVMPDADATLAANYATPIDRRYASDANFRAILGSPVAVETADGQVRLRPYQNGRAYWTPAYGPYEVHGEILNTYVAIGGHPKFGVPTTDQRSATDGVGTYSEFTGAGNTSATVIYWSPATGAHEVYGAIFGHWNEIGRERFYGGYPTTGELGTPDGVGRYNEFQRGAIYWSPATGAHEVYGAIFGRWNDLGRERSYLGYPTSGEYSVPGGRRNNFQHGYIFWNASTRTTTDVRTS